MASEKINKVMILRQIKSYYQFKRDVDFATFLGISAQTLNSWFKRETFDIELLHKKCTAINPDFLFTGQQPLLRQAKTGNDPEVAMLQSKLIAEMEKSRMLEQKLLSLALKTPDTEENALLYFKQYLEDLNKANQSDTEKS